MEKISSQFNKIKASLTLDKIKGYIANPYAGGIMGFVTIMYGGYVSHTLPPPIGNWFKNPIIKIIFMFIILFIHRLNPMIAIGICFAMIVSISILSRQEIPKDTPYERPNDIEATQMNQEVDQEFMQRQQIHMPLINPTSEPEPLGKTTELIEKDGLHPRNRPTDATAFADTRIEDPNDPRQLGFKIISNPNINTAIYELNPPFAKKTLPGDMDEQKNMSLTNLPSGGPTRYSACHGYSIR